MRQFIPIIFLICLALVCSATQASGMPWKNTEYSHYSDKEPLKDMLSALAASQDVNVIVSDRVKEVVSLHYKRMQAKDIFNDLIEIYGLMAYYDGESLYVYKDSEVQRASLTLQEIPVDQFIQSVKRMGRFINIDEWEVSNSDNTINLSGPERMVSDILDLARRLDKKGTPASRQIYKWRDKNGRVHFSNQRPENIADSEIFSSTISEGN